MRKGILRYAFFVVLIGNCHMAQAQQRAPLRETPLDAQIPQIIVASQPDSSLSVSTSTRWATAGREMLDLYVVVKNNDAKPVRAYTTRLEHNQSEGQKEMCLIENIYFPGKVLLLDQTQGRSRFIGIAKNAPPPPIQVSIDYIEFADGSTWGQDICQAAEYLAGERAGGKAAIEWLQALIKEKGLEAAMETIRTQSINIEKPYNQSAKWEEGFVRGVGIIRHRVADAFQKEGASEVEVVLSRPYDASTTKQ